MSKIDFDVNTKDKPVSGLTDSLNGIEGITVTVSGNIVTVVFDAPVDSFTIAQAANQFRLNSITVYA
jgi:type II secretory pathway component GspD/PulD (secretin)